MAKHTVQARTPEIQQPPNSDLSAKIAHLAKLSKDELRTIWSSEFRREPPKGLTRDLLLRTLVWRLQEKAFGGHDSVTLKVLDAYARGQGSDLMFRRFKSGTVLVREYQGVRHTVTIAQDGFIWQETNYPNLSAIARAITGTNWNGPRFFGLREKGGKDSKAGEAA
jgi:hypothetical protein